MKLLRIVVIPLLLVAFAVSGCDMLSDKSDAEAAVNDFHQKLDGGDFEAIYNNADAGLKSASSEKDFLALLAAVHKKLGNVQNSSETNFSMNSVNLSTQIVLVYNTKFGGGDATETFTWHVSGGKPLLLGYNINSLAMMEK
jgi:hypothetical protein